MVTPEEARKIADDVENRNGDKFTDAAGNALRELAIQVESLQADADRLDWISRQGDEFSSRILQDCPGDGNYYVSGAWHSGEGKSFRDAVDEARKQP